MQRDYFGHCRCNGSRRKDRQFFAIPTQAIACTQNRLVDVWPGRFRSRQQDLDWRLVWSQQDYQKRVDLVVFEVGLAAAMSSQEGFAEFQVAVGEVLVGSHSLPFRAVKHLVVYLAQ